MGHLFLYFAESFECINPVKQSFDAGDVRRDVVLAQIPDEVFHLAALVCPQGLGIGPVAPGLGQLLVSCLMFFGVSF